MKKVRLKMIKVGQKFKYGNSLFIKDSLWMYVNLTCGTVYNNTKNSDMPHLSDYIMVTPVKFLVSDIIAGVK